MELKTVGGGNVTHVWVHHLVADRLRNIIKDIQIHYGDDLPIVAPALMIWGSNLRNSRVRRTDGTVGKKSIHSWGLAFDIDGGNNGRVGGRDDTPWLHKGQARLSQPIYEPFWRIVEHHGGHSLGRNFDYDWMHFQFVNYNN